ncbi:sensor histidine kinase [Aegicerativicinus sediminis]|uniref:sensor histidine kinase n=1 Tax=Aegicerativicinus sediminis TaxID=2893202 RepID=UPI001E2CB3F3|nr:HAMP domain-containing sensor histidine kinase [Aegicerativicinus sediminis]
MNTLEAKLRERVKELTCLYEVTSIIVNSDYDQLEESLQAITNCLKRGWQFVEDTEAEISVSGYEVQTAGFGPGRVCLTTNVKVFNKQEGYINVGYPSEKYTLEDFLEEEQTLLDNVGLAVGNLLERKQIRDNELATRKQMEWTDRLHILGEITAGIAHELNTPLANILGFAELLQDSIKDPDSIRDLDKIMENAIFSREIVKKLMFFACEMPQEMDAVELIPAVENVLKLLKPQLRAKNIEFVTQFEDKVFRLTADDVQLTQVLFNLIMNAIYYSPENGIITIAISEEGTNIKISVADEGEGIKPENTDKVFEPFFTTKPTGEGSGLGLSVVHGIINSHKGTISHAPNKPKGTVFTIYFPKL